MAGKDPSNMRNKRRYKDRGPQLWCDLPIGQPGAIVHHELLLSGWAVSQSGISNIAVQIDDDRQLQASYGLETPWVAETMPDMSGAGQAGYRLLLDTSQWRTGTHKVTVVAIDKKGRREEIAGQVDIVHFEQPRYTVEDNLAAISEGKPIMWLEEPRIVEGICHAEGPVEVSGWAYAESGIDSVIVTVDKGTHYEALCPISRPDLLADYGAAIAGEAGFVLQLHATELPPGRHTVSVVAIASDGQAVGVEGDVICLPEPTPVASAPAGKSPQIEWLEDGKIPQIKQDEAPERYDPDAHGGLVFEAEHQLRYRWASTIAAGREVLDAGCGVGWGAALLAEAGAKRTVGIDISKEALENARGRTRGSVELVQGDLCKLPFDDASFDLITCFEAIEHIADPDVALEELRRVLRPDGVLLISTPRRRVSLRDNVHHLHEFTPGEFERALRDRFDQVRIHRQQTCLSSTILDDEAFAIGDGNVNLGTDVRKLSEGRPGGEEYTVGVAGHGPLPKLERMAMLASAQPVHDAFESAFMWEDRAHLAEADAAANRTQANLAQMHQKGAMGMLRDTEAKLHQAEALKASLSWRVTRPLRSLKHAGRRLRAAIGRGG